MTDKEKLILIARALDGVTPEEIQCISGRPIEECRKAKEILSSIDINEQIKPE